MQNPLDRYCETAIKWLIIHSSTGGYKHELEPLTDNQVILINTIKESYFRLHDNFGRRIDSI